MTMTFQRQGPARALTIRCEGNAPCVIIAKGPDRLMLEALTAASPSGCILIANPASRWAAYVHNLRNAGTAIETITEKHDDPFAGHHVRYAPRCDVTVGHNGNDIYLWDGQHGRGCSMMAFRLVVLCHRYGSDADRAAMLAAFVWGCGNE